MDLYTTIVGLYSQNRHEVLRVVNTAIHSKCNLSEGIEVIHTGFYCFTPVSYTHLRAHET